MTMSLCPDPIPSFKHQVEWNLWSFQERVSPCSVFQRMVKVQSNTWLTGTESITTEKKWWLSLSIFLMAFSYFFQLILMEALNCARRCASDKNSFLPCTCYQYTTRYKHSCLILLLKCKILRCKFHVLSTPVGPLIWHVLLSALSC